MPQRDHKPADVATVVEVDELGELEYTVPLEQPLGARQGYRRGDVAQRSRRQARARGR